MASSDQTNSRQFQEKFTSICSEKLQNSIFGHPDGSEGGHVIKILASSQKSKFEILTEFLDQFNAPSIVSAAWIGVKMDQKIQNWNPGM